MESYYEWVKENRNKKITDPDMVEWPMDMLAFSIFGEDFPEVIIEISDVDAIEQFRLVLLEHGTMLNNAREKLREFIVSHFNIEDVLYVSKNIGEYSTL